MMPQTAMPTRLPDSSYPEGGERQLRIHTPSRATMNLEEQPVAPGGMRFFQYLKYRWAMVLFLGGLLGSALAYAAWTLIPSKYTTYSMVRVLSDSPVVHSKEDAHGRGDFATYIKTQAAMIRSNFVLTAALRDPIVAGLPLLREQPDPVRYLEEELKIEFQDGSEIIKIGLMGDDSRAIAMIVNSVQEAFFREVVEDEITRKKGRLRQLEDSINRMQNEVKQKHKQIKQSDVDTPNADAVTGLSATIAVSNVMRTKENLGKIETDIENWENEKASLEKKLGNVADEVPPPAPGYVESLDNDGRMQTLSRKIDFMNSRIEYLIKASGDSNLSSVIEMRQKVADAQEEREKFKHDRIAEHQKVQLPVFEKKLKDDLERCKSALTRLNSQKSKMELDLEEYETTLSQNGQPGDVPEDFQRVDLRERKKIITEMLDKANLLRLEVNAPPRIRDFQRAAVPMKKDMKKQIMGTILAGLIGFGLVGAGVVVFESRVRRALSLSDVRHAILGPVLGILPIRGTIDGANAWTEAVSEAMEKTRTNILQQFSRTDGKIISIVSALNDEGKSYLACELARCFAQAGSRTLLIDFDFRAPSLHHWLGVANERGFCEVLTSNVAFQEAIQLLPSGVTFLPAGKWNANVRLALTPDQIETQFQWLRQQFDYVVLNTHPLLAVAETMLYCRNSDGVLLSVERYASRLSFITRAHEKLAAAAPETFGIIFQGASADECLC